MNGVPSPLASARLSVEPYSKREATEMHPQFRTVSSFLALALALPTLARAEGTVPQGTRVHVVTDQSVGSKTAKAGQTIAATVSEEATARSTVITRKGAG